MPEEAIELADALVAFTAGSAYANHLDDAGIIAVGRMADLAVLDRDLFDRGAGGIADTRVVATFVDGVAVHETPDLEADPPDPAPADRPRRRPAPPCPGPRAPVRRRFAAARWPPSGWSAPTAPWAG